MNTFKHSTNSFKNLSALKQNGPDHGIDLDFGECEKRVLAHASTMPGKSVKDQIKAINRILSMPQAEDYVLTFGKYKGFKVSEVKEKDYEYMIWLLSSDFLGPRVRPQIERAMGIKPKRSCKEFGAL